MKTFRIIRIFLFLTLAVGCQTKTDFSKIVIYYVPFQFTANESVTIENIKEKANSIDIADKTTIIFLTKLLSKSHDGPGFDGKKVRLQIILSPGNRTIWVDADGGLLEAGHERRLDGKEHDELESLVSAAVATGGEMR